MTGQAFNVLFLCTGNSARSIPEAILNSLGHGRRVAFEGSEKEKQRGFSQAFLQLQTRISLLLALPMASLDRMSLPQRQREIGNAPEA